MKLFKVMRLVDKYKVEESREPDERGSHIVFHITETLRGCNYQRVFKGSFKDCQEEKKRLEAEKRDNLYINPRKRKKICG